MVKSIVILPLLGRILMAALFIVAGINKAMNIQGITGYIGTKLPQPEILAYLTIVLEIGGGILLIIGFMTRWVSLALAVFVIVATFLFHPFWEFAGQPAYSNQLNHFLKNGAVVGALLGYFMYYGAGPLAADRKD